MHPTASYANLYKSVEKAVFTGLGGSVLLISHEDYATRYVELEAAKAGFLWDIKNVSAENTGSLSVVVGATTIDDLGGYLRRSMIDQAKSFLDTAESILVYDYNDINLPVVNGLAKAGPVRILDSFNEPNGFKTQLLTVTYKYGQVRT